MSDAGADAQSVTVGDGWVFHPQLGKARFGWFCAGVKPKETVKLGGFPNPDNLFGFLRGKQAHSDSGLYCKYPSPQDPPQMIRIHYDFILGSHWPMCVVNLFKVKPTRDGNGIVSSTTLDLDVSQSQNSTGIKRAIPFPSTPICYGWKPHFVLVGVWG